MKPLVLINYVRATCDEGCCPKCANPRDWSLIDRDWCLGDKPNVERSDYDVSKRLTNAELAAEVWHSVTNYFTLAPSADAVTEASRNQVIERFATLPHYDEVTNAGRD